MEMHHELGFSVSRVPLDMNEGVVKGRVTTTCPFRDLPQFRFCSRSQLGRETRTESSFTLVAVFIGRLRLGSAVFAGFLVPSFH